MLRPAEQIERARRTVEQSLPGCASLVFVSESVRTEGAERGFDFSVRTSVIHNPFGPTYAEPCAVDARTRDGWVFVGALTERKSPMLALEAAARCGASLVFVGEGPEEVALRTATERLGLGDRVDFKGWATPEGVRDALLRADLLCLPSLSEGFSVAYLEALACGLPVIGAATNVAELERQMGAPCGVGIRGDDVGEVVAAAQAIRATTWVRTELRRRALAAFSPSAVAQRYATVLHESVSGRRR
jgi:glycosyltransferase involved in cell wall biosynthesis